MKFKRRHGEFEQGYVLSERYTATDALPPILPACRQPLLPACVFVTRDTVRHPRLILFGKFVGDERRSWTEVPLYVITKCIAISCIKLTLSLLMSYIYIGLEMELLVKPEILTSYIYIYVWTYILQRWKPSLSICWTMFRHWINAESFPVSQLCVNTLPTTKVTLIKDGI
jgi:hypothetical protein